MPFPAVIVSLVVVDDFNLLIGTTTTTTTSPDVSQNMHKLFRRLISSRHTDFAERLGKIWWADEKAITIWFRLVCVIAHGTTPIH